MVGLLVEEIGRVGVVESGSKKNENPSHSMPPRQLFLSVCSI